MLGHSKIDHHHIFVYANFAGHEFDGDSCLTDYDPTRGVSGWNETFIQNICTLYNSSVPYHIEKCDTASLFVPYTANNTIYIPPGSEVPLLKRHLMFTQLLNGVVKCYKAQYKLSECYE